MRYHACDYGTLYFPSCEINPAKPFRGSLSTLLNMVAFLWIVGFDWLDSPAPREISRMLGRVYFARGEVIVGFKRCLPRLFSGGVA